MGRKRKVYAYCVAIDDAIDHPVNASIVEAESRTDALEYQRKIMGYGDVVKRRSVLAWVRGPRTGVDRDEIETADGHRLAAWLAPDDARVLASQEVDRG